MAGTVVPYGSPLAQQAYRAGLSYESERAVRALAFMGEDPGNALVQLEFGGVVRGASMNIRFMPIQHDTIPKARLTPIVGNETSREPKEDSLALRYFVLADGGVPNAVSDQQMVDYSLVDSTHTAMARETSEVIERSLMNQLSGNTIVNDTAVYPDYALSGGNIVTQPDTNHHFFCPDASGSNANETAVGADSTSVLTNRVVNNALMKLRSLKYGNKWPMAPATTPWGDLFIVLASGEGMEQVRENNTDSDVYDLSKAAIQGGMSPDVTHLVTGEGFILGKALYLETDFATAGNSGAAAGSTTVATALANTQRAVLMGARAMHVGYGEGFVEGLHLGYTEHAIHRYLSMAIDTVHGFKAVIVDGQRWGSAVITHYASV